MDAFSRRSTTSFSTRSCTRAQISETEGGSALWLVTTGIGGMQQPYAAGVEASELQSSHPSAGHDLTKQPEASAGYTSSPIDRISASPLLLVTTPSSSL